MVKINIDNSWVYILLFLIVGISYNANSQSTYNYKKKIEFLAPQVSGAIPLVDFPVLVNIIDVDLRSVLNGGKVEHNSGYDIIFALSDCIVPLDHQVEKYDPTTGELVVWIRLPNLDNAINTEIYMYYGDQSVVTDPSTTAVWSANYGGVWHMNQDPSTAAPELTDYTANTNDGTKTDPTMNAADLITGKIGNCIDFDGIDDTYDCGNNASLMPNAGLTVSAWANRDAVGNSNGNFVYMGGFSNVDGYALLWMHQGTGGTIRWELKNNLLPAPNVVQSDYIYPFATGWHYWTATYDPVSGEAKVYLDAVLVNTDIWVGTIGTPIINLQIGGHFNHNTGTYQNEFDGALDEVRSIMEVKSADWIATEYNNQNSPSTFYIIHPEEIGPFDTLIVDLGNDTAPCESESLILDATFPNATYLWQDNSTNSTFDVTQQGTYWVEGTVNNCSTSDTINVNFIPLHILNLGNDTICQGDTATLTAYCNSSYQWADSIAPSIIVGTGNSITVSPVETTTYYVYGNEDTISTTLTIIPYPNINLGNDTTLCEGNSYILEAGTTDNNYIWQDSSTDSIFTVTQPGEYWVNAINICSSVDTIVVYYDSLRKPDIGDNVSLCPNENIVINIEGIIGNYLWQDSSSTNSYTIYEEGTYWVEVSNTCGSVSDTLTVHLEYCDCFIYVPNAFTPNNDNINDSFSPSIDCLVFDYQFIIYNRWGEIVFETSNPNDSWDGNNSNKSPIGLYIYVTQYSHKNKLAQTKYGTVSLLR